jgi:hypothetical protein
MKSWKSTFYCILSDKPEVTISTASPYQVEEKRTATMVCSVSDANPNTDITWRWVKTDSPSNVLHSETTYTIYNIQRAASGTYSCTASNSIGTSIPVTVEVDVQCKYLYLCTNNTIGTSTPVTVLVDVQCKYWYLCANSTIGPPTPVTVVTDVHVSTDICVFVLTTL